MNWKEVVLKVNQEAVEAIANILNELGAGGVVIDTEGNKEILKAYYYNDADFPLLMDKLKNKVNKLYEYDLLKEASFTINETRHEDWANNWHDYFKAIKIGEKFIISPSWEKNVESDRMLIEIDPGMAFGVGSHETTQMCIQFLEEYIQDSKYDIRNMLDIGTGTGILAIAAAYLGLNEILGIDIDPAAVNAAKENIKINAVENKIIIKKGDLSQDITGVYSIITANLLPNLIIELLPSIPALMDNNSILILSGIIREKKDIILEKMKSLNLTAIDEKVMNDWLSLVVVKSR
ncbi:50S ribosomal protein L11 methyltransferase [Natronospora cellulosivora (SeqCode)]